MGAPGQRVPAASAARLKVVSFPRRRPAALNHPSLSSLLQQPFPHHLSALLISLPHPQPPVLESSAQDSCPCSVLRARAEPPARVRRDRQGSGGAGVPLTPLCYPQLAMEALEQEQQSLRVQIARVLEDRQQLMHLKMSLSLEVATYR